MGLTLGVFCEDREPKSFKQVREVTTEEYADYKKAVRTLLRLPTDKERFQDVLVAFVEYMDVVADHEDFLRESRHVNGAVLKRELNTRLSNYLRAIRSFVDHSDKALSDRYGADSDERRTFRRATNEVYDKSFSYRMLEQARNYTQHVGEAIEHISYGWRALDPETRSSEPYLDIEFARDKFLEWKKLKASFRKELAEQPERIPVTTHVQQVTGCIRYLDTVFIAQQVDDLVHAAKHVMDVIAPLEGTMGRPVFYTFEAPELAVGERGNFSLQADWIPADLARFVLESHEQVQSDKEVSQEDTSPTESVLPED